MPRVRNNPELHTTTNGFYNSSLDNRPTPNSKLRPEYHCKSREINNINLQKLFWVKKTKRSDPIAFLIEYTTIVTVPYSSYRCRQIWFPFPSSCEIRSTFVQQYQNNRRAFISVKSKRTLFLPKMPLSGNCKTISFRK